MLKSVIFWDVTPCSPIEVYGRCEEMLLPPSSGPLRKEQCPAVHINNTVIPQSSTAKYLGLHFDSRLTWKQHIVKKENR
jgi:hypothetical protein